MVVRFAIEPDALIDGSYSSPRDMKDVHKRLIRLWEQYGILVDPGKGPNSITSKFDNQALRNVRRMWQEAWKTKSRCRRFRPDEYNHVKWELTNSPSELGAYGDLIDLALVESVRGVLYLGIPEEDEGEQSDDIYSVFCEKVEAALLRYSEHSHSLTSIIDLSHRTVIPARQCRTKVWATWFKGLAQRSKEVAIIDRYGFSRRGVHGIYWTLQSLGDAMSDGVVSIYSSAPSSLGTSGVLESDIVNHIGSLLTRKPSNLKSVTVFMFDDQEMTKDRYIKF